jgi:hypothetical protein
MGKASVPALLRQQIDRREDLMTPLGLSINGSPAT